ETCASDEDCGNALVCAANKACVEQGAGGAICDTNHPCKASFACSHGTCVAVAATGAPCESAQSTCSLLKGDYCAPNAVCSQVGLANGGEACGAVDTQFVACAKSGVCKKPSPTSQKGTCVAAAADGQPCGDATNGPACIPPARCVNGACKL